MPECPPPIPVRLRLATLVAALLIATWIVEKLDSTQASRIKELYTFAAEIEGEQNDDQVLCVDLATSVPCLERHAGWRGKTVLWLGNSQLPTINQLQPGDRTMVDLLHTSLRPHDHYVFGAAPPNANLQEHYLLFEYLAEKIRPDVLLLPVFFDDLRESGVRPGLRDAFDNPSVLANLQQTEIGRGIIDENVTAAAKTGPESAAPMSSMDSTEAAINTWIESKSDRWKQRGTYRALIFVSLHYLRNTAFGIDPQSVRRMIPARYERNIQALHALLDSASAQQIQVVMYIPPIRNDVAVPYDMVAYERFKDDLSEVAVERGVGFADLENVVPAQDWGTKVGATVGGNQELDFMHFTAAGHKRMAAAIEKTLFAEVGSLVQRATTGRTKTASFERTQN